MFASLKRPKSEARGGTGLPTDPSSNLGPAMDHSHLLTRRHMTRQTRTWVLGSLLVITGCATQPGGAVMSRGAQDDRIALMKAAQDFLRAFDHMEWEPFHASWSSSPTVFFPFTDTPERVDGPAVATRFRQFFDDVRRQRQGPPYLNLRPRDLRADVLGNSGIVTFMLGQRPGNVGRRTLVFVIERGGWKLAHLHASVAEGAEP